MHGDAMATIKTNPCSAWQQLAATVKQEEPIENKYANLKLKDTVGSKTDNADNADKPDVPTLRNSMASESFQVLFSTLQGNAVE